MKKGTGGKKRPARATSNVFAMFDQAQIQEFKEVCATLHEDWHAPLRNPSSWPSSADFLSFCPQAFNMIDQNRDGFIDKDDLHDVLVSLGKFWSMLFKRNQTSFVLLAFIGLNHGDVLVLFCPHTRSRTEWPVLGNHDGRCSRIAQLHNVSHSLWREAER